MPREYFIIFSLIICCCQSAPAKELTLSRRLLDAIRYADSGGDVCALGDSGGSLGAYQIMRHHYREAVDANRALTNYGRGEQALKVYGIVMYVLVCSGSEISSSESVTMIISQATPSQWLVGVARDGRDREVVLVQYSDEDYLFSCTKLIMNFMIMFCCNATIPTNLKHIKY